MWKTNESLIEAAGQGYDEAQYMFGTYYHNRRRNKRNSYTRFQI